MIYNILINKIESPNYKNGDLILTNQRSLIFTKDITFNSNFYPIEMILEEIITVGDEPMRSDYGDDYIATELYNEDHENWLSRKKLSPKKFACDIDLQIMLYNRLLAHKSTIDDSEIAFYAPQFNGRITDGKITHEIFLDPSRNTLASTKNLFDPDGNLIEQLSNLTYENAKLWFEEYNRYTEINQTPYSIKFLVNKFDGKHKNMLLKEFGYSNIYDSGEVVSIENELFGLQWANGLAFVLKSESHGIHCVRINEKGEPNIVIEDNKYVTFYAPFETFKIKRTNLQYKIDEKYS